MNYLRAWDPINIVQMCIQAQKRKLTWNGIKMKSLTEVNHLMNVMENTIHSMIWLKHGIDAWIDN